MKAPALLSHPWSRRLVLAGVVLVLLALVVNWMALGWGTGATAAATESPSALYDRIELASSVTGGKSSNLRDLSIGLPPLVITDTIPPNPPIIVATKLDGSTYISGTWTNQTVYVEFKANGDTGGSGVAKCTPKNEIASDQNYPVTGNCTDNAGNVSDNVSILVKVDKTPPIAMPTADTTGVKVGDNWWYKPPLNVLWNWQDGGSGVDTTRCTTRTPVMTEGKNVLSAPGAPVTCYDTAGNVGTAAPYTVYLDRHSPSYGGTTTATSNGVAYAQGTWTRFPVIASFQCLETTPGSGVVTNPVVVTWSQEGANQTIPAAASLCKDQVGWEATAPASYPSVNIDMTKPKPPTAHVDPAPNAAGWNNSRSVTVSFTSNGDQGIAQSGGVTCTGATTLTTETAGTDVVGTCTDAVGWVSDPVTVNVKIDWTPPAVTENPATRSPQPNKYGWNNVDVKVNFGCADTGGVQSGIAASNLPPVTVTGEGKDLTATSTGSCTDKADNSATMITVRGINIDRTPPIYGTVGATAVAGSSPDVWATSNSQPYYNNGMWTNGPVDVSFKCDDSLSGEVTTPVVVSMTQEGKGQTAYASQAPTKCQDHADNTADKERSFGPINIDLTKPYITTGRSSQPNQYGWYKTDVTVSFTCNDALSGPASGVPNPLYQQTLSSEGANQSVTSQGTCKDAAGNLANPVTDSGINIDKTPPTITANPPPGSPLVGCTTKPVFTANDSLSGYLDPSLNVQGPVLTVLSGGGVVNRFTVTAQDLAGNVNNPPATFDYMAYSLSDPFFLPPIEAHTLNLFNLGSVIPLKFQLRDCSGQFITTADARVMIVYDGPATATTLKVKPMANTNQGDTGDQFRVTGDTYMYNWQTRTTPWIGNYKVSVKIGGVILRTVDVGLR